MCSQLERKTFAVGFCRLVSCYTLTGELGKCVRRRQIDNMNTKGKLNQRIKHFCQLKGISRYLSVQKNVTLKLLLLHLAWPPMGKTFIKRIVELLLHLKAPGKPSRQVQQTRQVPRPQPRCPVGESAEVKSLSTFSACSFKCTTSLYLDCTHA